MKVTINGNPKDLPPASALTLALDQLVNPDAKGVAVAVNNTLIPKARWNEFVLGEGDKVTVFKATQGG